MTLHTDNPDRMTRRTSVYLDDYRHANPIPAACRIDNIIYSSIIHGVDGDGGASSLLEQAQLMFSRLRDVVHASGAGLGDVVKVTMWMRDRADRDTVNHLWLDMFPEATDRPARQTVDAQLDGEKLIQCDFVAVIGAHERGEQRS